MMMFIARQRLWVAASVFVLLFSLGCIGGFLTGNAVLRSSTLEQLGRDTSYVLQQDDALANEAGYLAKKVSRLAMKPCSNEEISYWREQIYSTLYIRDLGRIKDGRIACSAQFEENFFTQPMGQPDLIRKDKIRVFVNHPPYTPPASMVKNSVIYLFQIGDFYVVQNANFVGQFHHINADIETEMPDMVSHTVRTADAPALLLAGATYDQNASGQVGDKLYVTRCSNRFGFCTTLSRAFTPVVKDNVALLVTYSTLGAMAGTISGLLLILFRQRSRNLGQQLRRAIRKGNLTLAYQPIVDLHTGKIVEAEALARWTDEDGYSVRPDIFIPLAEEQGFVRDLTKFVVRKALSDFGDYLRSYPEFRLNINVTASDLCDDRFPDDLALMLSQAGVSTSSLGIELIESATVRKSIAIQAIRTLRERGHSVKIDDFGTGYSSLAYLQDLDVDAIKIDKAFTQSIETQAVISTILPQMLAMADSINLQVIVEGIETEAQAQFFSRRVQTTYGQGWLFGRPVTATEFFLRMLAPPMNNVKERSIA